MLAVFSREAVRTSRRGRTFVLRVLWAAALVLVLSTAWRQYEQGFSDVASLSVAARGVFKAYSAVQRIAIVVTTPLLVGGGLAEEIDEKTIELVALSRLRPISILVGKMASRLLTLALLVLSGLPLFGIALSLGGVSVQELAQAFVADAVLALSLAAVGSFFGLSAKGPIAPVLASVLWLLPAMVVVPMIAASTLGGDASGQALLSPLFSGWATGWDGLLVVAVWAPIVFAASLATTLRFRVRVGEAGVASGEGDDWRRFSLVARAAATIALLAFPIFVAATRADDLPTAARDAVCVAWAAGAIFAGTLYYLELGARVVDAIERPRAARDGRWARLRRGLLFEPVLWREAMTRANGPATLVAWGAGALWLALLAFVLLGATGSNNTGFTLAGGLGTLCGALIATLLGTAVVAEERRAGTLELLLTTTYRPWRLVLAKLSLVFVRAFPLALAAQIAFQATWLRSSAGFAGWEEPTTTNLAIGHPELRALAVLAWTVAFTLACAGASMAIAARARPLALAWTVAAVAPVVLPFLLAIPDSGREWGPDVLPQLGNGLYDRVGGTPPELLTSTVLWGVVAVVSPLVLVLRLRRWAVR